MILDGKRARVYAYARPADMRKGFDGLAGAVRETFETHFA